MIGQLTTGTPTSFRVGSGAILAPAVTPVSLLLATFASGVGSLQLKLAFLDTVIQRYFTLARIHSSSLLFISTAAKVNINTSVYPTVHTFLLLPTNSATLPSYV